MKKIFLILFGFYSIVSFSQRINEYEFVIIPTKFQFQRTENEYRLNALLKSRLEDFGFKAIYKEDALNRTDLDPCLCLNVDVVNVSNIFLTKLQIEFIDCTKGVVFQSDIGGSEEKERHESFNEALTGALKSVRYLNYKFKGEKSDLSNTTLVNTLYAKEQQANVGQTQVADLKAEQFKIESAKAELAAIQAKIQQARLELEKIEQEKNKQTKVLQVAKQDTKVSKPEVVVSKTVLEQARLAPPTTEVQKEQSKEELEKINQTKIGVASAKEGTAQTANSNQLTVTSESNTFAKTEKTDQNVLYAAPVENGYELKDATSKVVLVLTKTIQPDYFDARIDKKYGLVFKKNDRWIFEYYFEGQLIVEDLNIKF